MSKVVVVALPRESDPVWRYSSEKVPHLTILYLEVTDEDLIDVVQFVKHAADLTMHRFGLDVDRRGTLGDEQADVLFFDKKSAEKITNFRSSLLGNSQIKRSYDAAEQFPEWTPHLTMGYPSTPAKKDDREYPGFGWVSFDRIAVWTENYDGPTVNLRLQEELMMSEKLDTFLAHFGVKGMKWGVRRTDAQLGNKDGGKNGVKDEDGVDVNASKVAGGLKSRDAAGIDNPKDIVISEDAIRFVKANLKEGHEMSTREIKETLERAKQVALYNERFNPDAATLAKRDAEAAQARVDKILADREYSRLTAKPGVFDKAKSFVLGVGAAYSKYNEINEKAGGIFPDPLSVFKNAKQLADESGATKIASDSTKPSKKERKAAERAESARRQEARDTQNMQYYQRLSEGRAKVKSDNSILPPRLPATQAVPSRPAPATILNMPKTVQVPNGPNGTIQRPPNSKDVYPAPKIVPRIYHKDVDELIKSFSDVPAAK